MFKVKQFLILAVVFLSAFLCTQSFAAGSGAYRLEVPDAAALAVGGAVVGQANTPAAIFFNPAGMTQMKGSAISVNLAVVQPRETAHPTGGAKTEMERDTFFIPSLASVTKISEKVALGIGVTSSWGLGTEWAEDSFARYAATETSLKNQDYIISLAYQLNDQLSVGMGVVIDYSEIEKDKKIKQFLGPGSDADFELEGDSTAAGFQASALYKLNERHQFGVQYLGEIERKYHGTVNLDGLNDAMLTAVYGVPSGTFGSSYETNVTSKATLPQSVDVGYCYRPNAKLTLNFDVLWMGWNTVQEEELGYPDESNQDRLDFLNLGNPAERNWKNALSMGMGAEYAVSERLRLRGGYFFHDSPIPEYTWEPNLPDADSHSIATGFGYDISKALTLDMTYSAMFYDTRSIDNDVGAGIGESIDGKYEQWTSLLLTTLTYKF
jgi:long-chain fatty acid transport protein